MTSKLTEMEKYSDFMRFNSYLSFLPGKVDYIPFHGIYITCQCFYCTWCNTQTGLGSGCNTFFTPLSPCLNNFKPVLWIYIFRLLHSTWLQHFHFPLSMLYINKLALPYSWTNSQHHNAWCTESIQLWVLQREHTGTRTYDLFPVSTPSQDTQSVLAGPILKKMSGILGDYKTFNHASPNVPINRLPICHHPS